MIDSRTSTKTRHPDSGKTTKYGTPLPRRSAPPQPQKKATPTQQAAPVPKPRQTPVLKTRSLPISKPWKGLYPVYEDLDKAENDYQIPVPVRISPSKDKDDLAEAYKKDEQNFTGEIWPAKKGSKVTKEDKELPPLPPRSLPATSTKRHRVFTNCRGYDIIVSGEGKEQEPVQDTGLYEPINFHASDEESDVDEPLSESQSISMYTHV